MLDEKQLSGSYESLFQRGDVYLRNGDIEGAKQVFSRLHSRLGRISDKVRKLRPELEDLRVMSTEILASLYRDESDWEMAGELYQELIDTTPASDHSVWEHAMAWVDINKGNVPKGLDKLRELTLAHPDEQSLWVSLSGVLVRENLLEEAEAALKRAITLPGEDGDDDLRMIYGMLFVLYKRQKRYDDAETLWKKWIDDSGEDDYLPLYEMYLEIEQFEKCASVLKDEKNAVVRNFYMAELTRAQGDSSAAKKWWKKTSSIPMKKYTLDTDMWAEAALHTPGFNVQKIIDVLVEGMESGELSIRGMLIFAIALIHENEIDRAHQMLKIYWNRMVTDHLAEDGKIPYLQWRIFADLWPEDMEGRAAFEGYFNMIEPTKEGEEA